MMKFNEICSLHIQSLQEEDWEKIRQLCSGKLHRYEELPQSSSETLNKIGKADALLVSLLVDIPEEVITHAPNLRYIGVFGTSKRRIDLEACAKRQMTVTSIAKYCQFETAEFVMTQILNLARHTGPWKWRDQIHSIAGKTLGILGLGDVGKELAKMAIAHQMKVLYTGPNRKKGMEEYGLQYRPKEELLASSDFISIHSPPDIEVLKENDFYQIPEGSVLINTCPGMVWDMAAFQKWSQKAKNIVVLDRFARQNFPSDLSREVKVSDLQAYRTAESIARLKNSFIENIEQSLKNLPS